VAMGRSAGHLAMGIGKAAGATLTLIAEEFPRDEDLEDPDTLRRIAPACGLTPEAFRDRYGYLAPR
jgi:6-phosphofructokinase